MLGLKVCTTVLLEDVFTLKLFAKYCGFSGMIGSCGLRNNVQGTSLGNMTEVDITPVVSGLVWPYDNTEVTKGFIV